MLHICGQVALGVTVTITALALLRGRLINKIIQASPFFGNVCHRHGDAVGFHKEDPVKLSIMKSREIFTWVCAVKNLKQHIQLLFVGVFFFTCFACTPPKYVFIELLCHQKFWVFFEDLTNRRIMRHIIASNYEDNVRVLSWQYLDQQVFKCDGKKIYYRLEDCIPVKVGWDPYQVYEDRTHLHYLYS